MNAKRAVVFTLAVLMMGALSSLALGEQSITDIVKKVKPAVVTVITYDAAGKADSQGTGFLVSKSHVITNYHVIDGAAKAEVKTADGKTHRVKGLAGADEVADIARLELSEPIEDATVLVLAKSLPQEGEKIVVVGSPLGLEQTVSDGIVSAVRDIPGVGKYIQLTAPMSPGSSGSPVVNLKGEVVGVACAVLTEGQSLNFAVASEHVIALKTTETSALGKQSPRTGSKSWSHLEKGIGLLREGDYGNALPHFQAATEADPTDELAWCELGYCYDELGKYTEAIDAYKQAIRIKPDYAEAHCNLGAAYGALGRHTEAIDALKQAIRIKPDDVEAHCNLGLAYYKVGRYTEAVDEYKQAIRIKPSDAAAHFGLGATYYRLGRYGEAIDAYKQAVRIKPDYAEAHSNLGAAYGELGRYKEEMDAYKQAIRITPDDAVAHYNLGLAYGKLRKYAEVIDAAKQAIRLKPDFADAHFLLDLAYFIQDKKGSALDEYKILKELDGELANKLFDIIYK